MKFASGNRERSTVSHKVVKVPANDSMSISERLSSEKEFPVVIPTKEAVEAEPARVSEENDMLIDFSDAGYVPITKSTNDSNVQPNFSELDFLLSVMPQHNSVDNFPQDLLKNVLHEVQQEVKSQASRDATNQIPTNNSNSDIAFNESSGSELKDEDTNTSVHLASSSVGFTDSIPIDDSEFNQFMEQNNLDKVKTIPNESSDWLSASNQIGLHSPDHGQTKSETKGSAVPDSELLNTLCNSTEQSLYATTASTSLLQQNGLEPTSSDKSVKSVVEPENVDADSSTCSQPRFKKVFHKDLTSKLASSKSHKADAKENVLVVEGDAESRTIQVNGLTNSNQLSNSQSCSSASNNSSSSTAEAGFPTARAVPNDGSPFNEQTGQVQSLPVANQKVLIQQIPTASPPSYSSVIAGDYHAGTIIQEGSSFAASSSEVSNQDIDESVEQAVEATEDAAQDHVNQPSFRNIQESQPQPSSGFVIPPVQRPGQIKPHWIPDEESPNCAKCNAKFTFTKRRHHCRACGRVFCSSCCSSKSKLGYLNNSEARVCVTCYSLIIQADDLTSRQRENASTSVPSNAASAPIPVVRNEDGASNTTQKSVRFSDGTKPDHPEVLPATPPLPARNSRVSRSMHRAGNTSQSLLPPLITEFGEDGSLTVDDDPDPALVISLLRSNENDVIVFALSANLFVTLKLVQYSSSLCYYFVSFGLDAVGLSEVALLLEIDSLDHPFPLQAFTLYSHLFNAARKGKVIHANDFIPIEDFINQGSELFGSTDYAGLMFVRRTVQDIGFLNIQQPAQSSTLFSPTVQFSSTLFALLIHKSEVPWAKLFYSRLLLVLGAKYKQYPYPLINYHRRASVCFEVANTILGILCDFRNYKYRVVPVAGLSVHVGQNGVNVKIPCNRFSDVMKIINSSNEHVVALGCDTFLTDADTKSHLVCLQNKTNLIYRSEVIKHAAFQNDDGNVGAAFIVFNGSLKSGSTQQAKCAVVEGLSLQVETGCSKSFVFLWVKARCEAALRPALAGNPINMLITTGIFFESATNIDWYFHSQHGGLPLLDGVMVQLLPEKMSALKESLKAMEDFRISCGHSSPGKQPQEQADNAVSSSLNESLTTNQFMEVRWVPDDTSFNIGLSSPIDFSSFEGVDGYNVQGKSEKKGKGHVLRWNQVFFFKSTSDILDMSRLAENIANGCFKSLVPHVKILRSSSQTKIGVRVNIHPDDVGYAVGSRGLPLPDVCLNALDDGLIPLTHEASTSLQAEDDPVVFELIFSVLDVRPSWKVASKQY